MPNVEKISSIEYCEQYRKNQLDLAYGANLISKKEYLFLFSSPEKAAEYAKTSFAKNNVNAQADKIILSSWVLSLLSMSTKFNKEKWELTSEKLNMLGFQITQINPENLVSEIVTLHDNVVNSK